MKNTLSRFPFGVRPNPDNVPVGAAEPIYRAPMRARTIDAGRDAGASFGLENDLVGIGDPLDQAPERLDEAIEATRVRYGEKAARMLRSFAELPEGTLVWTRAHGLFHLGRISGPWRYEDSSDAREVGIHNVRPADWLDRAFGEDEAPAAVSATFARGGRNFQRTHDAVAERRTAELWAAYKGDR
jgi:hypothetical protein